ncbi:ankyrin repeat and SOCS box protein 3 [Amia ocellicauda]|uniref:ankyrin repeat and SOCS box protein 3 n=1 Tax=Amia ocellicauda TaxID=2972642 RepID=UPI003463F678
MDFTEAFSDTCSAAGLAARQGDAGLLKRLIRKGYSLDISDNRGWIPIHEAAFSDSPRCLGLLLRAEESGSYVNSRTYEGETPLHLAAMRGSWRCVALLLRAGADPNQVTNEETTPLFIAVQNGHPDVVQMLLSHGAEVNGSQSLCGWNALHQAAFRGLSEITRILLDRGVDKETQDDFGITPLFIAAQYGQLDCLKMLADSGANVNCQARDRATPLFIAAQEGHTDCVQTLLSCGADPNLYCNDEAWQLPIHAAAQHGRTSILELLVPVTDRACDTGKGKVSPVYSAVLGGRAESLSVLLREGYSPNAQECLVFEISSPLCLAISESRMEMALLLLSSGVRVLPQHYGSCLQEEHLSLFRALLEQGDPLPSGEPLQDFLRASLSAQHRYLEWLPQLLLTGFDPMLLLDAAWIASVTDDVLNFALEFTNWKRIPPAVKQILSSHAEKSTWVQRKHFDSLPPLSHLCRLAVRAHLRPETLRSDHAVRHLPLPTCLQDYLLYRDVRQAYGSPARESERHRD